MLSLRTRVLAAGILWTIGLVILASALLVVAIEHSGDFRRFLAVHSVLKQPLLLLVAAASMAVGLWQVRRGLSPINRLRGRLAGVRTGRDRRVEGAYPSEVQPLVDDLNVLLELREQAVRRALAKAGDLAHGLKTPLAVLAREAECADAAGQPELALAVRQQVERMRRQIDYHLAHARAAASGAAAGVGAPVRESADGLSRTMAHLHADRRLILDVRVAPNHIARVQREDLDEMLGNLLDNACKWTRTRVVVESTAIEGRLEITVDDDGPGLAAALRDQVLLRGIRADEHAPGSGLGLGIVRELAELYGGSIALEDSPLGGLRARLSLPVPEA